MSMIDIYIIIRKIYANNAILSECEETLKAPHLNGEYHYRVIDIKCTTLNLCSNGELLRNSDRIPAYKGQLAIYNAALGELQGYIPSRAYILGKAWKYVTCGMMYRGNNCFDLLGHVDFEGFDNNYIQFVVFTLIVYQKIQGE